MPSSAKEVELVSPDFAAIQADPIAGPLWRAMMGDYEADLERAKATVDARSKGGARRGRWCCCRMAQGAE